MLIEDTKLLKLSVFQRWVEANLRDDEDYNHNQPTKGDLIITDK